MTTPTPPPYFTGRPTSPAPAYVPPSETLLVGPPAPAKRSRLPLILGLVVAFVMLAAAVGVGTAWLLDRDQPVTASRPSGGTPFTPYTGPTPLASEPEPVAEPAAAEPVPAPTATVKAVKISERQWKKIAKSPDDYVGKKYVIYGVVTQFDSATGADTFRADVAGTNKAETYDYETNTILSAARENLLDEVVQDDEFRAEAVVLGSETYDTQIGGQTTVPSLAITSIKVL